MNSQHDSRESTVFVQVCDLCDGSLASSLRIRGMETLPLVQCVECGLVITSPRPKEETISDWYPKDYYAYVPRPRGSLWRFVDDLKTYKGGYPSNDRFLRRIFYGGAALLFGNFFLSHLPYLDDRRRLLDVGCGVGTALQWAKDHGWECVGVEMDSNAVEIVRSSGLEVLQGNLEDVRFEDSTFDAITMSQVLEHTFAPTKALLRCRALLKPGGILLVAVPNFDSYFRRVMNEYWPSLELPRHLYHFDERTLRRLSVKCGFEIGEIRF